MAIFRQLCTRRWLTLSVLALVLIVACALLGRWQYSRSYRPVDGYSQEPAAVSLDSLDSAAHPLTAAATDRQVLLSGRYDASQQRIISGHTLGGAPVLWVVTPLRLADGSAIEVVRGWMTRVDAGLAAPAASIVQVTGRIRPLQASSGTSVAAAPGHPSAIGAQLRSQLRFPTRNGYVVRTAQVPPDPLSLQPVPSQPPPGAKQLYLQNVLYTVQWWVFALLVLVFWQRLFSAELAARRSGRTTGAETGAALMTPLPSP